MKKIPGFTLAELLIALAVLGVIATFTIPKVLQSQQNSQSNAIIKESASMLSGAYEAYKQQNGAAPTTMTSAALTRFMNYVQYETNSSIDSHQTQTTASCSTQPCVVLHNGARMLFWPGSFNGTSGTNFIWVLVDPDGRVTNGGDNSATAAGKSVVLVLYYNGRLATRGTMTDPSENSTSPTWSPAPTFDPPWFNWN